MVHYNPEWHAVQPLPPVCPKCGSHRTQVVGRSDDGRTVILRCSSCGERASVEIANEEADAQVAQPPRSETANI
jgi:uncharacterized Zn finger protein